MRVVREGVQGCQAALSAWEGEDGPVKSDRTCEQCGRKTANRCLSQKPGKSPVRQGGRASGMGVAGGPADGPEGCPWRPPELKTGPRMPGGSCSGQWQGPGTLGGPQLKIRERLKKKEARAKQDHEGPQGKGSLSTAVERLGKRQVESPPDCRPELNLEGDWLGAALHVLCPPGHSL